MMLRHPERIIYTPLQLRDMTEIPIVAQTICGRFIQSIKISAGLFEVANLLIFGSEFQISQQSSWCQDKWDTVYHPVF